VFTVAGLAAVTWVWWVRHGGVRIEGVVVDPGREWSADGGMQFRYWSPVVTFTPPGGSTVRFRSKFGTPVRCQAGQRVPVCYRAASPNNAVIDTFSQAWLVPITSWWSARRP
jgi:hypothetical protein